MSPCVEEALTSGAVTAIIIGRCRLRYEAPRFFVTVGVRAPRVFYTFAEAMNFIEEHKG